MVDEKDTLHRYLRTARQALRWKLDGLSEYDLRRPMTPTGTNLLGLVKHVASVEVGYFGDTFGRPWPESMPWLDDDAEPNADMWATPDESTAELLAMADRMAAHSDATIEALDLDAEGRVPWWGEENNPVTLHWILVHMMTETNRHAGHADIIRELIDGQKGHRDGVLNLPEEDAAWWQAYHDRVEAAARTAGERQSG
jgi:uncharacterized damage-inducible protein DinB